MFTGIVETTARVLNIVPQGNNIHVEIDQVPFLDELEVDQSIAHNGCCLSVTSVKADSYTVTAIHETMQKTNLSAWNVGTIVNLERCLRLHDRLDGHLVQGHIDCVAICEHIEDQNGSYQFLFSHQSNHPIIEKGSICINGVSLTLVDVTEQSFSVCIIPLTYAMTNFQFIQPGDSVNIEFDMIGKYVARLMHAR